jgi:hypothetical protein
MHGCRFARFDDDAGKFVTEAKGWFPTENSTDYMWVGSADGTIGDLNLYLIVANGFDGNIEHLDFAAFFQIGVMHIADFYCGDLFHFGFRQD